MQYKLQLINKDIVAFICNGNANIFSKQGIKLDFINFLKIFFKLLQKSMVLIVVIMQNLKFTSIF